MRKLSQEKIKMLSDKYNSMTYNTYDYTDHDLENHLKAFEMVYNLEYILENGVNTGEDLEEFIEIVYRSYYIDDKKLQTLIGNFTRYLTYLGDTREYGDDIKTSWNINSFGSFALAPIIPKEDIPNTIAFFKLHRSTDFVSDFFREKINFVNEEVYARSLFENASLGHVLNLKEDLLVQVLEYHLKKKKKRTVFYSFLDSGFLTNKLLEKLKMPPATLADMVVGYLKQAVTKKIRLEDIRKIRKLKIISEVLTNEILLVVVQKFIKEAEKEKLSCAQIEIILVMLFHYLGKNIQEDVPEAALLLAVQLDEEIDI